MRYLLIFLSVMGLSGCALISTATLTPPQMLDVASQSGSSRNNLIALRPTNHVPYNIGVYNCFDSTGQKRKSTNGNSDFSSAVPQDCAPFLIASLRSMPYYRVLERSRVDDVLKERQLATVMLGDVGKNILGIMHIADAVIMGQIVSYDRSASQSAGGIALSAIGGSREYVSDTFTFSLRAVSTQTGELIDEVIVKKTITSLQVDGHVLRLVGASMASLEYGMAENETVGLALQETIDLAVRSLTEKGIVSGWLVRRG